MDRSGFTVEGVRAFHRWTHASLDLVLDHLSRIPARSYLEEVPDFGFPTLRQQVIHIFNCEGTWIRALQRQPYVDLTPGEYPTVSDAGILQKETRERTVAYLSGLTNRQLNSAVELRFTDGEVAIRRPSFVLHHVLTHAFHHKGQIIAMCRSLGYPAPDTDMSEIP